MEQKKIPILFIVFNRPDTTKRVFEVIRQSKPSRLFIAADGPRPNKPGEEGRCQEVRKITENIDWECEVVRRYSNINLGCKTGVSSAIDWFFENVEEGIILEDDCLPDPSFFIFCRDLLSYHRENKQVMAISGNNFQHGATHEKASYYFSRYPHIWGWATWKRAWKKYDVTMADYPIFKKTGQIKKLFTKRATQRYWIKLFDKLYQNKIDTWDGQWVFALFKNNGLCATPNQNLISNIGFSSEATHTTEGKSPTDKVALGSISAITHPAKIEVNEEADQKNFDVLFHRSLADIIFYRLKKIFHV